MRYHLTPIKRAIIKKPTSNKRWRGCGEKGPLLHCWWECKLVQTLMENNMEVEPDILECEVKWALESITTNKASGCDGIPVELFQILKDDGVKVLHSICQQI